MMQGKEKVWGYGRVLLLLAAACFLLQIHAVGFVVCVIAGLFVCTRWIKIAEEAGRQQTRLAEAEIYMEQILYAFLQEQKILSALEDVYPLFEEGSNMRKILGRAIEHIKCDCDSSVERELKEIELAYANDRLTEIHHYLLSVEKYGGETEHPIEFLLENVRKWMERVRIYQADYRKYQRNVGMAVILSVIVCAVTNALLPDSVEVGSSAVCQSASVLLICFNMLICLKCAKRTGRNWLKSSELYEKENYQKEYEYVKSHHDMRSRWYKKQLTRKITQAFPRWLMDISLLLQTENVQVALYKTKEKAPKVLRPAIEEMMEKLEHNPESIKPYQDFLKEYELPDVRSAMRMLYALSSGGYGNGERQMREIMIRNQELLDRSERSKNEDSLAGMYALFLAPALTGAGKMLADMTMFLIVFLAQAGM